MNVQNVTIGKFMLGVLNYKNKQQKKVSMPLLRSSQYGII